MYDRNMSYLGASHQHILNSTGLSGCSSDIQRGSSEVFERIGCIDHLAHASFYNGLRVKSLVPNDSDSATCDHGWSAERVDEKRAEDALRPRIETTDCFTHWYGYDVLSDHKLIIHTKKLS